LKFRHRLLTGALVAALLPGAASLSAEAFAFFAPAAAGTGFEESFDRALESARDPAEVSIDWLAVARAEVLEQDRAAAPEGAAVSPDAPKQKTFWIALATAGVLGGAAYNSFFDGERQKFHFTDEGYFGQNTYAGGGDKASHFVSFYIVTKLMSGVFQEMDAPTDRARLMGFGVALAAGLMNEIGDGYIRYGFSYEDLIADTLGAATALGIAHYHLDDLVGFRAGLVPAPDEICCPYGGFGKDYTKEIYSGDLKIVGLGQRAHFDPGVARYLLFSMTYGSKGYPYSNPVIRERQVGFEVGLNFGQIMKEIGVPPQTWWGKTLYFLFDVIRFPYTQVGMYYDINHGKWHGPSIGDSFPGGP
jgi:hypothetical protein